MPKATGALVLAAGAAAFSGILLWRLLRSENKKEPDSGATRNRRTYGEAVEIIKSSGSVELRCVALEQNLLPLTFHDAGSECIFDNEDLMTHLLDIFTAQLDESEPNSQTFEETEARLCGWIISNVSFISKARAGFLELQNSRNSTVGRCLSLYLSSLLLTSPTDIVTTYDAGSKTQSLFLSVLQILVNVSAYDCNTIKLCELNLIQDLSKLLGKVKDEAGVEKLVIHILRVFVNFSISARDMTPEPNSDVMKCIDCVYGVSDPLTGSQSEEISERAILITTNLSGKLNGV